MSNIKKMMYISTEADQALWNMRDQIKKDTGESVTFSHIAETAILYLYKKEYKSED